MATIQTSIRRGVKNATTTRAASGALGLGSTAVVEGMVFKNARPFTGTLSGKGSLSMPQVGARLAVYAGEAVGGGYLMTQKGDVAKGAGFGLIVGAIWHAARMLQVNYVGPVPALGL